MRGTLAGRAGAVAAATVLLPTLTAAPAAAHERWFVENTDGANWDFFLSPLPLALTAAVVVAAVVWRLVALRLPTPELRILRPVGRLTPYVPRLLAIHLGVSLLALAATGDFLAHSLPLDRVPGSAVAGLAEAALGVWFITGIRLRPAALGLVALGPLALLAAGPVALGESATLLGVAAFLAILPPSDATFGRVVATPTQLRRALLVLRACVAVALVTLAFSEKFTNPELAHRTLQAYPALDVFGMVGIEVSHETFTAIAGAVELLFGLLVLSGALPQVAVLVAAIPFNATLVLFGQTELVGHLPVYGVFLTLLAYGSDPATAHAVRWLPKLSPSRGRTASDPVATREAVPA